jgi:hypothetical protein
MPLHSQLFHMLSSALLIITCAASSFAWAVSFAPTLRTELPILRNQLVASCPSLHGFIVPFTLENIRSDHESPRRRLVAVMCEERPGLRVSSQGKQRPTERRYRIKDNSPAGRRNVRLLSDIVARKSFPGAMNDAWQSLNALKEIGKPLSGKTFTMMMSISAEQVISAENQFNASPPNEDAL